jgi:predicted dithiol-disulfide oxidoreductase (DUF899 family)
MTPDSHSLKGHPVVSRDEWLSARTALLAKEKSFTRLRDELSQARRDLPWVNVETPYVFDSASGKQTMADLFNGKSQLVVYHFMFGPEAIEGCKHCSFWADNFNGIGVHLRHRDVSFVAVSRAPIDRIEAFKQRMDWSFPWVSSGANSFNYDFHASFTHEQIERGEAIYNYAKLEAPMADREGVSVFYKDEAGALFHTYSCFARGIDMLNTAYHYLDLVPKGRDEGTTPQQWVRYHDKY